MLKKLGIMFCLQEPSNVPKHELLTSIQEFSFQCVCNCCWQNNAADGTDGKSWSQIRRRYLKHFQLYLFCRSQFQQIFGFQIGSEEVADIKTEEGATQLYKGEGGWIKLVLMVNQHVMLRMTPRGALITITSIITTTTISSTIIIITISRRWTRWAR